MLIVNTEENLILEKVFLANFQDLSKPKVKRFRVDNYSLIDSIDKLRQLNLIKEKDRGYRLTLDGFTALDSGSDEFNIVRSQCEAIFIVIKEHYLKYCDEKPLTINSIAQQIQTNRDKVLSAVYYIAETHDITCGRSNDLTREDASITPYEKVLDHESYDSALENHRVWIKQRIEQQDKLTQQYSSGKFDFGRGNDFLEENYDAEYLTHYTQTEKKVFVHKSRINELEELNSTLPNFDLSKVIQICHELNSSYSTVSYYALASLQRMLIDHVPPLFDCKTFSEVANNRGAKSFKKHMLHLDRSLRNISDSFLHQHVRKIEPLPNDVTVNFSSAIDELLIEVIRLNKAR